MSDRTWFITGASRGFGRSFARAALAAGDRVAATARDISSLDDLAADHGERGVVIGDVELDGRMASLVSSIGGLAAFPLTGIYHASKWALEGFSESLRQ